MSKLGEIAVNGNAVSVFEPPHDEPDFPWVDAGELASAFIPRRAAKKLVEMTHRFEGGGRYATVRNGDRIATIICHAMAQGMCMAIDSMKGYRETESGGPAYSEYTFAMASFTADRRPMSFDEVVHALQNPGGKFLKGGAA